MVVNRRYCEYDYTKILVSDLNKGDGPLLDLDLVFKIYHLQNIILISG